MTALEFIRKKDKETDSAAWADDADSLALALDDYATI